MNPMMKIIRYQIAAKSSMLPKIVIAKIVHALLEWTNPAKGAKHV